MANQKQKTKSRFIFIVPSIALVAFIATYLVCGIVYADETNNNSIDQAIDEKQDQIKELDKKSETYRQMIELKQKKAQTLENQLRLMEADIASFERDIAELQKQIDETTAEIDNLKSQIEMKRKDIEQQKKILVQLIQAYYENDQDSLMEMLLKNANFSEFLGQAEYLAQTGEKVNSVLTSVVEAKNELDSQKKQLEIKKRKQKEDQGKISAKRNYLLGEQKSKEHLLLQTSGEEKKYQQLLAKIEKQKSELLGDISELSSEKSSDLAAVKATLKKPKHGLASTSWYFSQKDSRWKDQHIGFSNSLMKSYGCAVTSVAMVLRYHGVDIDPGLLSKQPIFYYDLIVWPQQWRGIKLASSTNHGNVSWSTIDKELKNKNPVIVFVKAKKKGAGHYVVIHSKDKKGKYIVHDPYWGANIFLDSTRALVSALYDSGTVIDQMIIYHEK